VAEAEALCASARAGQRQLAKIITAKNPHHNVFFMCLTFNQYFHKLEIKPSAAL